MEPKKVSFIGLGEMGAFMDMSSTSLFKSLLPSIPEGIIKGDGKHD